jgi:uncharacterized Zn finger protein (UPF0148 family)
MVFCANCGTEIAEILRFCPSCGALANKDQDNEDMDSSDRQLGNQDHKQARKDRYQDLRNRVERYKPKWDNDGVIQFKSDHVAILQRNFS